MRNEKSVTTSQRVTPCRFQLQNRGNEMTVFGYARVSSESQDYERQVEALKAAGAEKVFAEKMTGANADRPQLAKLMTSLKASDVVLVTKIDRLGRSTRDLLNLIGDMRKAGAHFKSLGDEMLDTTSANGELVFTILAAIATYDRRLIEARTGARLKRTMANRVKLVR